MTNDIEALAKRVEDSPELVEAVAQAIRDERIRWGWEIPPVTKTTPMALDLMMAKAALRARAAEGEG